MEPEVESEWTELARSCDWSEVLEIYHNCLRRVEAYCAANPKAREVAGPICLALGGLSTLYVGLKPVIEDPSRHDELASPEITNIVLGLARRVRRDVPEPE